MGAVSAVAFLLSFVASLSAYQIITPNAAVSWNFSQTDLQPRGQNITWLRNDTDPQYFTIILTNQKMIDFANQTLSARVDGSSVTGTTVFPPNGGWIAGSDYSVDFVTDPNHLGVVLAQSGYFNITDVDTISNDNTGTITPLTTATPTDTPPDTPTGIQSDTFSAITVPTTTSGATSSYLIQTGLLALLSGIVLTLA